MHRIFTVLLMTLMFTKLSAQTGVGQSVYESILRKNKKGIVLVYDKTKGEVADKTWLKYLGNVTTKQGKTYKIMTSIWVWGYSKRGTTRILVFDGRNHYVGKFELGMTYEAPNKILGKNLVFKFSEAENCDHKIKREVSFAEGIPTQIFLECKNGLGDIYYFDECK